MRCAALCVSLLLVCAAGCASSRAPAPRVAPAVVEPALPDGWCSGIERYAGDWGPEQRESLEWAFRTYPDRFPTGEGEERLIAVAGTTDPVHVPAVARVMENIGYQVAVWAVEYERRCSQGARHRAHQCYVRRRRALRAYRRTLSSSDDVYAAVESSARIGDELACRGATSRVSTPVFFPRGLTTIVGGPNEPPGWLMNHVVIVVGWSRRLHAMVRAVDAAAQDGAAAAETRAWIAWLAHGLPNEDDTVEPAARAALARAGTPRRLHVALELALARRARDDGDLTRSRELYGAVLAVLGDAPADRLDAARAPADRLDAARGLAGLTTVAFRAGTDDRDELLERANAALDRAFGFTHPTAAHLRIDIAAAAAAAGDTDIADALRLRAEETLAAARGRH